MKKFTFLFVFAVLANLIIGSAAFGQILQRGTATTAAVTNNASLIITKPTGVVSGDVMIANLVQVGSLTEPTAPAGWAKIDGRSLQGTTNRYATIFYKVAGGSEGTNYTFTVPTGGSVTVIGSIIAFSGVDGTGGVNQAGAPGGPFDVDPGTISVGQSASVSATAITTATANAAVIMLGGAANTNSLTWSGWATTSPGALAEILDFQSTNTTIGAAWAIKASAGGTGAGTVTLSQSERYGAILVALKPVTGPPPPPSVSLSPSTTQNIFSGGSVNFTATALNYPAGTNYTYTWTVAPNTATIPGSNPNTIAAASDVKNIVFPNGGTYTVSVNITRAGTGTNLTTATTTVNVSAPNLWSANGTGDVLKYTVDPVLGNILAGPANVFTPLTSTAALGKNQVTPFDANGCIYYLDRDDNDTKNGVVTIYAVNPDGTGNGTIGTIDMNGAANTSDFSFVRLGFDNTGKGWILAGGNTQPIYIASFVGKGTGVPGQLTPADINVFGNIPLTIAAPGVATEFQNGDLAITASGTLFALANVTGGQTYIYTLNSLASPTTLTRKWTVQTGGGTFSGSVNGLAWTQSGSLHFSTGSGIYFIDQATANVVSGTVQATLVPGSSSTTLADLASDKFPTQSTLPVKLGTFNVTKQGNNALIDWTTLTEINSDYFEIERSKDGINFESAGTKQAAGNSSAAVNYQFIDPITINSGILYYRLKSVDLDGKSTYSKIVTLRLSASIVKNFNVYPNPFSSDLKVELKSTKETTITIRISNAAGQLVVSRKAVLQTGDNTVVLSSELSTLKSGMYMMEVVTEEGKLTQKIIRR